MYNKKIKLIAAFIILILISNLFIPIALAISEEQVLENTELNNNISINEISSDTESEINEQEDDNIINEEDEENIADPEYTEYTENNTINNIAGDLLEENIEEDIEEDSYIVNEELKTEEENTEVEEIDTRDFSINVEISGYKIKQYIQNNIYYLFLPKGLDISDLNINYTGNVTEISSGTKNADKTITNNFLSNDTLTVTANDKTYTIKVMQTDIASICINLNDGITLNTVNSHSKDRKYSSTVQVFGANNSNNDIIEALSAEFKGRGNSTWLFDKKPYQIKFSKKQNLLGIGNGKSKKWVLLANYVDVSLLRDKIMSDVGIGTKLTNIPNSEFIDLFVNGEYIGNYLLTDKIETGSSRLKLNDEKGVLMELDNFYGRSEPLYMTTKYSGTVFAIKESYAGDNDLGDAAERAAMKSFENSINNFESAIYSKASWNTIKNIIDVDSFARLYLDMEFAEDRDSYNSSTFFYKDGENDKIHAGPLWDFDVALRLYEIR